MGPVAKFVGVLFVLAVCLGGVQLVKLAQSHSPMTGTIVTIAGIVACLTVAWLLDGPSRRQRARRGEIERR